MTHTHTHTHTHNTHTHYSFIHPSLHDYIYTQFMINLREEYDIIYNIVNSNIYIHLIYFSLITIHQNTSQTPLPQNNTLCTLGNGNQI